MTTPRDSRIVVLGLGYVGCVCAAGLARLGYTVTGVDPDPGKVASVLSGRAPFFEPGLEEWVCDGVASGRLTATTAIGDALPEADIAIVCVGTPSDRQGQLCLKQLQSAIEEIVSTLPLRSKPLTVAIRSTVLPGTCERTVLPAFAPFDNVAVVANPEFLREGSAVRDFIEPSLLVVGGSAASAVSQVAGLYSALPVVPSLVSLRTAEMIKYACNAFHAVKVCFANEIGAFSESLGIDGQEVMSTLCQDSKLNISQAYLSPGFAFGGSCLPKDLRALTHRARAESLEIPLIGSALVSNRAHLERAMQRASEFPAVRLGVVGLAFKQDTDDLRESPVIALLEHLLGKGRDLRVFDPRIRLAEIYGANRRFLFDSIPHIGALLVDNLADLLRWSDGLVVAQHQKPEALAVIGKSGLPVLDLTGIGSCQPGSAIPASIAG